MEKHIVDEKTGISYTLVGDYYIPDLILPEENRTRKFGIWGCGCPVDTSANGRSTDRAGRRDNVISDTLLSTKRKWLRLCR